MGESTNPRATLRFDRRVRLEFRGATISSDAGLLACRELDDALGLTETADECLQESRGGRNVQHRLVGLLRQSVYSRLAGYEDTNDAERLADDPTMWVVVGDRGIDRPAASTNTMSRFETEVLTQDGNVEGLGRLNAKWLDGAMSLTPHRRVILDMDSSESPVHGEQEGASYNGSLWEHVLSPFVRVKHTRNVARDNTVKYQWQVLQLLPGMDRPSYAGLRVEVLERADGQLMIRYHGERVDFQESPQPPSSLWGATNPSSVGSELQPIADDPANGHLNGAQRSLLDSLEPTGEEKAGAQGMGIRAKRGAGKPVRHSLHRTPTQAQRARWEAVQKAKRQGLSLRAIARKLGMSRVTTTKYALAESPPTKTLQRQRACQGGGARRIDGSRGLARVTFSLFT